MATERLFFALWPGEQQRTELARIQSGLAIHRGRMIHPKDLHITIFFLGDLDPSERACAEEAAGRLRVPRFAFAMDRVGGFPRAQVLWCGVASPPGPLLDLVHGLGGRLRGCGFRVERRDYMPHVTLARKARPIPARELEPPVFWPVSEFALVIDRPDRQPRYRAVRSWPLMS